MTTIWNRFKLLSEGTTPALRFQEEADVGVAAVLTRFRQLLNESNDTNDSTRKREDIFQEAVDFCSKRKFKQQKEYVQEQVASQLETAIEAMIRVEKSQRQKGNGVQSVSGLEIVVNDPSEDDNLDLKSLLGFSIQVQRSSIPNAGDGVYLNGKCGIGSLVALYPGIVYVPEHRRKSEHLQAVTDNIYARARFDSVIIDAKNAPSNPKNKLAIAHKINHPPAGTTPNVIPFAFDFQLETPLITDEKFIPYIPNKFIEEPSRLSMFGKRAFVHSLAFIATANIENEELLLNYRYNPNHPYPKWYTPVDIETDRAMWS